MIRFSHQCRVRYADQNNQLRSAQKIQRGQDRLAPASQKLTITKRRGVVMILAIIVLILSSSISLSMGDLKTNSENFRRHFSLTLRLIESGRS